MTCIFFSEPIPSVIIWNTQRPDMMMGVMMDSTVINSQVAQDIASADLQYDLLTNNLRYNPEKKTPKSNDGSHF